MPRSKRCKASGCATSYVVEEGHPPFRNWCSSDCAIQIARDRQDGARKRAAAKAKKKEKDQSKANKKAVRELNRRDVRWQHKRTQIAFNKMRVLEELAWFAARIKVPRCISCGKPDMDWCCGHLVTQGSNSRTRYDPLNTHLQCNRYCNMALSGNRKGNKTTNGYDQGLLNRYGKEQGQAIIDHCESQNAPKKWDWEELEAMREGFNARIKVLQKGSI